MGDEATTPIVTGAGATAPDPAAGGIITDGVQAAGNILPAATPVAPTNGLAAIRGLGLVDPGGDWGVLNREDYVLEGRACRQIETRILRCSPEEDESNNAVPDVADGIWERVPVSPVTLESNIRCSMFGAPDLGLLRAAVDDDFRLCGWRHLATELWTGEKSAAAGTGNRFLASQDAIDVATGETVAAGILADGVDYTVEILDIVTGIALLEGALATCSCGGVHLIHVSPRVVAPLSEAGLIERVGSRIFTKRGTLIVDDDGYPGTGPSGAPAKTRAAEYIYGTSTLTGAISPDTDYPLEGERENSHQMRSNDLVYQGQKRAAVSWLCCHFMARVEVTC